MKTIMMEATLNLMLLEGKQAEVQELANKGEGKRTKTDVGYIVIKD
jgi:hypothetical protein